MFNHYTEYTGQEHVRIKRLTVPQFTVWQIALKASRLGSFIQRVDSFITMGSS